MSGVMVLLAWCYVRVYCLLQVKCDRKWPCHRCLRLRINCRPQTRGRPGRRVSARLLAVNGRASEPYRSPSRTAPSLPPLPSRPLSGGDLLPLCATRLSDTERCRLCGSILNNVLEHLGSIGKVDPFCATRIM